MSEDSINFTNRAIDVAVPQKTTELTIRLLDWKRIFRKIGAVPQKSPIFSALFGLFSGISGSCFVSLIPLRDDQPQNKVLFAIYLSMGVATALTAVICLIVAKIRETDLGASCREIQQDMEEIHDTFYPGKSLRGEDGES